MGPTTGMNCSRWTAWVGALAMNAPGRAVQQANAGQHTRQAAPHLSNGVEADAELAPASRQRAAEGDVPLGIKQRGQAVQFVQAAVELLQRRGGGHAA